ncbi:MAG: sel1 repeat family protein [Alphaproteobacteria bacterium]|nr:MAG: sel1 repeat family protein [Alphaproteobacteria bacterium]
MPAVRLVYVPRRILGCALIITPLRRLTARSENPALKRLLFATALLLSLPACTQTPSSTQDTQSVTGNGEQGDASVPYDSLLDATYAADISGFRVGDYKVPGSTQEVDRLRKAAEQGNAEAQNKLGFMYFRGDGVPQDYAQSMNWFRKAAEQGDADAQHNLGGMYASGNGVPQDYAQATNWYRKAAEQGDTNGQMLLCLSYALGKGVPQDYVLAYAWCNVGVSSMYGQDQLSNSGLRGRVSETLSATQLAEAQRLSSNWQKGQSIRRE